MEIAVTFADGQVVKERWDGRARSQILQYESAVPAVSAEVDPRLSVFEIRLGDLQRRPLAFTSWQRSEDYYNEGLLVWMEVDSILREQSKGTKSIDDFAGRQLPSISPV